MSIDSSTWQALQGYKKHLHSRSTKNATHLAKSPLLPLDISPLRTNCNNPTCSSALGEFQVWIVNDALMYHERCVHVMCFCAYLLSIRKESKTALSATRSQARACDKRKPERGKNTRLSDRNAKSSDSKAQNRSIQNAGPREVASSFYATKGTKKNGGPGAK